MHDIKVLIPIWPLENNQNLVKHTKVLLISKDQPFFLP